MQDIFGKRIAGEHHRSRGDDNRNRVIEKLTFKCTDHTKSYLYLQAQGSDIKPVEPVSWTLQAGKKLCTCCKYA